MSPRINCWIESDDAQSGTEQRYRVRIRPSLPEQENELGSMGGIEVAITVVPAMPLDL